MRICKNWIKIANLYGDLRVREYALEKDTKDDPLYLAETLRKIDKWKNETSCLKKEEKELLASYSELCGLEQYCMEKLSTIKETMRRMKQ